jgi:hypothetical protein
MMVSVRIEAVLRLVWFRIERASAIRPFGQIWIMGQLLSAYSLMYVSRFKFIKTKTPCCEGSQVILFSKSEIHIRIQENRRSLSQATALTKICPRVEVLVFQKQS